MLAPWKKSYDKPRQKKTKEQRHHFDDKDTYSQRCGFSSIHVQMRESDHKEERRLRSRRIDTLEL